MSNCCLFNKMASLSAMGPAGFAPGPAYAQAPAFAPASTIPSYAGYGAAPSVQSPSYGAPAPIPFQPIIASEEALVEEVGAGAFGLTKLYGLPLKLLIPVCIVLPIIAIVLVASGKGGNGLFGNKKQQRPGFEEETTPFYEANNSTEVPTETAGYGQQQRRRRQADTESSSGIPSLSIAQVERLTQVVFSALRMQECQQRLLCELGTMSRAFSESAHSVAQAVEQFVPTSIKESYDVFAKAENCEKYKCGSLEVKK